GACDGTVECSTIVTSTTLDRTERSSTPTDHLFADAHTASAFTDEPVTEADLRAIYDMVKWGPTAMNSQPLRIAWVTSTESRERLLPLMSPGNRDKTALAPVVALVAADLDFHENLPA